MKNQGIFYLGSSLFLDLVDPFGFVGDVSIFFVWIDVVIVQLGPLEANREDEGYEENLKYTFSELYTSTSSSVRVGINKSDCYKTVPKVLKYWYW